MAEPRHFSFIETDVFRKQVERTGSLEILFRIQGELLANPKRGAVIEGTNGARKARTSRHSGKGKSGGYRYIYLFLEAADVVFLLLLYGKDEQDDLTSDQKKQIGQLVREIKGGYRRS